MDKELKPCRVCGKPYEPCNYCEHDQTAFHWREVACSPECGKEYFSQVEKARLEEITLIKPVTLSNEVIDNTDVIGTETKLTKKSKTSDTEVE